MCRAKSVCLRPAHTSHDAKLGQINITNCKYIFVHNYGAVFDKVTILKHVAMMWALRALVKIYHFVLGIKRDFHTNIVVQFQSTIRTLEAGMQFVS